MSNNYQKLIKIRERTLLSNFKYFWGDRPSISRIKMEVPAAALA